MTSPSNGARSARSTWSLPVFVPGILILVTLLAVCTINPKGAEQFFLEGQRWVAARFSWFYLLAVAIFSILLLAIAASRYGSIRLGADDTRPEFSFTSWLAMPFAELPPLLLYQALALPGIVALPFEPAIEFSSFSVHAQQRLEQELAGEFLAAVSRAFREV